MSRRAPGPVALLALLAGTLGAARAPEAAVSDGRYAMGTVLELTLRGPDPAAGRALLERLYARSESLEGQLSNHDGASAVSALNASAGGPPAPQPPELARLLRDSKRLSARTDGAFDVTVGPLVALWREAAARGRLPAPAEVTAARARLRRREERDLEDRSHRRAAVRKLDERGRRRRGACERRQRSEQRALQGLSGPSSS